MALNLSSCEGIIKAARGLLLDKTVPYRYSDTAMLVGLNLALLEAKRLRPDFFVRLRGEVPQFDEVTGESICVEPQFRVAFLYGIAGYVLLRDEEDVQDMRAQTFMSRFESILTGLTQPAIKGGTPSPGEAGSQQRAGSGGGNS